MALSLLVYWGPAKASGSQTPGISAEGARIPVPEKSHPLEKAAWFAAASSRPGGRGEASQDYQVSQDQLV